MTPQLVDPYALVQEAVVDATYRHADGEEEHAILHLDPSAPRSPFAVVLRPGDGRTWFAQTRFRRAGADPLTSGPQQFEVSEPFISLGSAGFRVVTVELLEDPAIFTPNGLLAIRVVLGADVADPALPVATLLLRATRTAGSLVVPGVPAGAPVAAAIDLIRHGEQPARTTTRLAPAETTLYVQL